MSNHDDPLFVEAVAQLTREVDTVGQLERIRGFLKKEKEEGKFTEKDAIYLRWVYRGCLLALNELEVPEW